MATTSKVPDEALQRLTGEYDRLSAKTAADHDRLASAVMKLTADLEATRYQAWLSTARLKDLYSALLHRKYLPWYDSGLLAPEADIQQLEAGGAAAAA